MTKVQDGFVLAAMVAGGATGNAVTAELDPAVETEYYNRVLVPLRTKLNKASVPTDGRFVIIDPDAEALLLLDKRFIANGTAAGDARLLNGSIGYAAGFRVLVSNSDAVAGKAVAGVASACTVADQIVKVRGIESENWFGTRVQGLHVYGAKVVRPANLVVATWTVAEGA